MRVFFILLGILLTSFLILLGIYHFGELPNRHKNGFNRNYVSGPIPPISQTEVPDTTHEIIGSTASNWYVSLARQDEILEIGKTPGNKIRRIRLPFFERFYDSLQFSSLEVRIDSPHIYLFAENKPAIVSTDFDSTRFDVRILPPGPFTREVITGPGRFVLRKLDPRLSDQVFTRYDLGTGELKKEDSISPVYGDGGIITDGQLYFDAADSRLCYVYYYKNLFLSFDTALNTVRRFYSLDTTRSFKMQVGLVENNGTKAYTNISPTEVLNKTSDVCNGLLFNMSGLKADNESDAFFNGHSIIDVIRLHDGDYLGSICLPTISGNKLSRFMVAGDQMIVLYTHTLVIYPLDIGGLLGGH